MTNVQEPHAIAAQIEALAAKCQATGVILPSEYDMHLHALLFANLPAIVTALRQAEAPPSADAAMVEDEALLADANSWYSAGQIEEMEDRCRVLRNEIRNCCKVIESGKADPWWREDKSRFEQELRGLKTVLDLASRQPAGVPEGWRSIESAPKDGTRILLWTDTDNPEDHWYINAICEGEHTRISQTGRWDGKSWEKFIIGQPTHWMPLPAAPATDEGEAR